MIPIPEFPGYYATEDGHIFSAKSGMFLKESKTRLGYARVNLRQDGKTRTQEVHRLIAAAYLGPAKGRHVLHGPKGQEDNSLGNLRYGTHDENMLDKRRWGPESEPVEWPEGFVPTLSKRDVIEISLAVADEVPDSEIAVQFTVPEHLVQDIALGKPGSFHPL